jgi:SAM-dependent methyltransferase
MSRLRRLAAAAGRELRMRRPPAIHRRTALAQEVQFWRNWFATGGLQWPEEYRFRIDPEVEVDDPLLREILDASPQARVSILDVGAGPITSVGFRFRGKELAITAVDPLADEYDRILRDYGIEPPVRTERRQGEDLLSRFAPDSFDVVFARNALDHTLDPLPIIHKMVSVARPGGHVVGGHRTLQAAAPVELRRARRPLHRLAAPRPRARRRHRARRARRRALRARPFRRLRVDLLHDPQASCLIGKGSASASAPTAADVSFGCLHWSVVRGVGRRGMRAVRHV